MGIDCMRFGRGILSEQITFYGAIQGLLNYFPPADQFPSN